MREAEALEIIAESSRRQAETMQMLVHLTGETRQLGRLTLRMQAVSCTVLGIALLVAGFVVWQGMVMVREHAVMMHMLAR